MLTLTKRSSNLNLSLPHEVMEIGLSETNGVSRFHAVFLCAKSQFIMLDWVRQLKDWLGSFVPVDQPCSVRHHDWSYVVGFKTLQTEAIMPNNHTTKPSKPNTPTSSVSPKANSTDIQTVENELIEISLKIGNVSGKNSQFTHGLALRLSKLKVPISQLSIADLILQIDGYTLSFNSVFGGES